jgi:hypothetical protein
MAKIPVGHLHADLLVRVVGIIEGILDVVIHPSVVENLSTLKVPFV